MVIRWAFQVGLIYHHILRYEWYFYSYVSCMSNWYNTNIIFWYIINFADNNCSDIPEKMDDNRKEPCLKLHQLVVGQRKDLMKRCCWELESAEKGSPSATKGLWLPLQRHTRAKDWASRTSSRFTSCSF